MSHFSDFIEKNASHSFLLLHTNKFNSYKIIMDGFVHVIN